MLAILITFVLTSAGWLLLAIAALRRVAKHLQNAEALACVTKHVLVPAFAGKKKDEPEKKPGSKDATLC